MYMYMYVCMYIHINNIDIIKLIVTLDIRCGPEIDLDVSEKFLRPLELSGLCIVDATQTHSYSKQCHINASE